MGIRRKEMKRRRNAFCKLKHKAIGIRHDLIGIADEYKSRALTTQKHLYEREFIRIHMKMFSGAVWRNVKPEKITWKIIFFYCNRSSQHNLKMACNCSGKSRSFQSNVIVRASRILTVSTVIVVSCVTNTFEIENQTWIARVLPQFPLILAAKTTQIAKKWNKLQLRAIISLEIRNTAELIQTNSFVYLVALCLSVWLLLLLGHRCFQLIATWNW